MKMKLIFGLMMFVLFQLGAQTQIGSTILGDADYDRFGNSVSISADGKRIAVGGYGNDNSSGTNAGHVRVYDEVGGAWIQVGADIKGDGAGDRLGRSVSLSSNGKRLAIGAPENSTASQWAGQVKVYEENGGIWTQVGNSIYGNSQMEVFGSPVSISSDGKRIVVSATSLGTAPVKVRIYEEIGGVWTQVGQEFNNTGSSVSISANGKRIALGAPYDNTIAMHAGKVAIYDEIGGVWQQVGQNIYGEFMNDLSGYSVSLSDDGTVVAMGAIIHDNTGYVRVFEESGGNWSQLGSDIDASFLNGNFGYAISLSPDGNWLAIGANGSPNTEPGTAQIYELNGGNWIQNGLNIQGDAVGDRFGNSVSISSGGARVVVAGNQDNTLPMNTGYVKVFQITMVSNESIYSNESVRVLPNPTYGNAYIEVDDSSEALAKIKVTNNLGRIILENEHAVRNNDGFEIDLEENGVYFITIQLGKKLYTHRVVKLN